MINQRILATCPMQSIPEPVEFNQKDPRCCSSRNCSLKLECKANRHSNSENFYYQSPELGLEAMTHPNVVDMKSELKDMPWVASHLAFFISGIPINEASNLIGQPNLKFNVNGYEVETELVRQDENNLWKNSYESWEKKKATKNYHSTYLVPFLGVTNGKVQARRLIRNGRIQLGFEPYPLRAAPTPISYQIWQQAVQSIELEVAIRPSLHDLDQQVLAGLLLMILLYLALFPFDSDSKHLAHNISF
ncbi:hypothetical protein VNO77_34639 [Canavalia gladiata]|uniref:Uncharacterized protein n=1 Tax=Canavalia gladiata TaxID=3824 RepID=A0AAN9KFS5_CANGL